MSRSHPLLQRFENEFFEAGHLIEWTIRENDFFFRPRHAPVEVILCCLGRKDYAKKLLDPQVSRSTQGKVIRSLNTGFAVRFWPHSQGYELFFRARFGLVRFENEKKMLRFDLEEHFFEPQRALTPPEQLGEIVVSCEKQIERIRKAFQCVPEERGWPSVV